MTQNLLLKPSPFDVDRGELVGRDPRDLRPADFAEAGVKLRPVMKAIREFCRECCGGDPGEARKCVAVTCPLWALRMGNYPKPLRAAANAREQAAPNPGGALDPEIVALGPIWGTSSSQSEGLT